MSAPLPSALRARFQEYVGKGLSGRRRLRRIRESGAAAVSVQGRPKGHGKLAPHQAFPEELVARGRGITLPELAGALEAAAGVVADSASIERFLRKPGLQL